MKILFSIIPRYMNRNFLINFLFLILLLLFIVMVFDLVELMRRASKYDVELTVILKMAFLKLPEVGQMILPFAVLFSAIFTFWRLNRTSELYVMRAAGLSALQFTLPLIFAAFCIGMIATGIINPVSSVLLSKFEKLENKYIKKSGNLVSVSKSGVWLRQNNPDGGYSLLNAAKLNTQNWQLNEIILIHFDDESNFVKRIEAETGQLDPGYWVLNQGQVYTTSPVSVPFDTVSIKTDLTPQDIMDTFSSVENVSFWKIPEFIKTLKETGFSTERLEVHYQSLIARPFFFAAMILLAAAVSLRPMRQGGTVKMVILGIGVGFLLFFIDSMLKAFGISQKIPIFLAAWTPTIVSILLGGSVLLQQEEG